MPASKYHPPEFLVDLLNARSPSGFEGEAQTVVDRYLEPHAQAYGRDTMGNRFASINLNGSPTLMFAGHMDELGLMIKHVDDKGFLFFEPVGGHDRSVISGRRVAILTRNGVVRGVTGKRAVHLMDAEARKRVPEIHQMWIDIAAKSRKDALSRISIGDVATYDQSFELLRGSVGVARAFDNKAGVYVVAETLKRLARLKALTAKIVTVATSQEEIGTRGAIPATYSVNPDLAIAVDVTHATDHPDCDNRKHGAVSLGEGPVITRGPNINPFVFERLLACAEKSKIPVQIEADARPTGTDGRAIQVGRKGVATGVVSIPLRYMHTPSEVVDLKDIERCIRLLAAFAKSLKKGDDGVW
jgi:endoglucanase